MTARCATRPTTHPHDLPSPFEEGRPQISALSPLITITDATSPLPPDSSSQPTQLKKTRLFARYTRSIIPGDPQTVLGNRPVPPRLLRRGPDTTRGPIPGAITKDKRAEYIVGHPIVRGPRYLVSSERQTRDISPSASCCSRVSSSALCRAAQGQHDLDDAKPWAIFASGPRSWPPPTCCRGLPCPPPTDTMAINTVILVHARPRSAP